MQEVCIALHCIALLCMLRLIYRRESVYVEGRHHSICAHDLQWVHGTGTGVSTKHGSCIST